MAALDVGNDELANHCLKMIMRKFPKSTRVGRLTGMMAEAQGIDTCVQISICFMIYYYHQEISIKLYLSTTSC